VPWRYYHVGMSYELGSKYTKGARPWRYYHMLIASTGLDSDSQFGFLQFRVIRVETLIWVIRVEP
jgi:hypothetical protein